MKLIQLAARSKRNLDSTIKQHEIELQYLLDEQEMAPLIDIRHKIDSSLALNLTLTTQTEKSIRWSKHEYYTMGDKRTTLLPGNEYPRKNSPALPKLKLPNGQPTQNLQLIVREFQDFFSTLYRQQAQFSTERADFFFQNVPLLHLQQAHTEFMEGEFSEPEIKMAIKSLHPFKDLCPDGFSGQYYQKYQQILIPHYCAYFNDIRRGICIPAHENTVS